MKSCGVVMATVFALSWLPGRCLAQTILSDPLAGSTSGVQDGGSFTGGGWQAPQQIWWDLGQELSEGTLSVEVTNWNPNSDSDQHMFPKQQIINMYEASHGSPHDSDASVPKTSFFNIRTGATYDNCFKFLSSPAGFTERIETRVEKPYGTIDPAQTHTISISWTAGGTVTASLDGVAEVTHEHGKAFALRYVFIGTDNAPPGTYGPQHGVIYKNLLVTGSGGNPDPDPDADPDPVDPLLLSPTDDSWVDPGAPGVVHGSSDELRVGADGRAIFMKFDVVGVGPISSARLRVVALNGGGGGDVRTVVDTAWTEGGLTFDNKPPAEAAVLDALGKVEIGETYEFDVSAAVACDGVHSFAITSADLDGSGYWSRESAQGGPQLVLVPDPNGGDCEQPPEQPPDPPPDPGPEPPPDPAPPESAPPESAPPESAPPESAPPPDPAPAADDRVVPPDVGAGGSDAHVGGPGLSFGGGSDAGASPAKPVAEADGGCFAGGRGRSEFGWAFVACLIVCVKMRRRAATD